MASLPGSGFPAPPRVPARPPGLGLPYPGRRVSVTAHGSRWRYAGPVEVRRTLGGAAAGALAAGVWAAQQPLDKRVFGSDYDDVELLGKVVTRAPAWPGAGRAHSPGRQLEGLHAGQLAPPPVRRAARGDRGTREPPARAGRARDPHLLRRTRRYRVRRGRRVKSPGRGYRATQNCPPSSIGRALHL